MKGEKKYLKQSNKCTYSSKMKTENMNIKANSKLKY